MKSNQYKIKADDGTGIHVYEWLPDKHSTIRGVVQIVHGMAEHAGRYEDFAGFLTSNDFAVYANDHRGHGKTAGNIENVGFVSPKNGWEKMVSDLKLVSRHIKEKNNEKPLYVLGHSMGSYLTRNFMLDPGTEIRGVIISGTGDNPGFLGHIGIFLTQIMLLFYPAKSPSPLMFDLSFGAFNKPFKPNRTKFDWLSRDNDQVDKYVNDPFCGGVSSIGFFRDFLKGVLFVTRQNTINNVPKELPVLCFSGDNDPAGNNGKGVTGVYQKFKKAGVKNITLKLYAGGRHEMLNETNKDEVYRFTLDWLKMV